MTEVDIWDVYDGPIGENKDSICETDIELVRPGYAKTVKDQWRAILQGPDVTQTVRVERCLYVNRTYDTPVRYVRSITQETKDVAVGFCRNALCVKLLGTKIIARSAAKGCDSQKCAPKASAHVKMYLRSDCRALL